MIEALNPALIVIGGGLLIPFLLPGVRSAASVLIPLVALWQLLHLEYGDHAPVDLFGYTLITLRVDALSVPFATVFLLAAVLAALYAWQIRDTLQQTASLVYAGAALGAVFAGDLITLFGYWELMAISSVFLIWAARTERSYQAGLRYLVMQISSGVLLLAGVIVHIRTTGSITFDQLGLTDPATFLIFIAFGIKCAFPLLHNWLHDSYPEATVTGTVWLSIFTTKVAIYAFARGYAGTESLILIGVLMAVVPVFYAAIENDLRRVLTYSLNSQLGFMVVGIGIGSELALNGTVAHAFCSSLYQALLFMGMGAVLLQTGTIKASELGGLYKWMPYTLTFYAIGAASIASFPLFSGFISKPMILVAVAERHDTLAFLLLLFASVGALYHSGVKVIFCCFFASHHTRPCTEAPTPMRWAMGLTALACIAFGVYPWMLYAILPYATDFQPYTIDHLISQLQLIVFALLAFAFLLRAGVQPTERPSVTVDFDWTYRKALPTVAHWILEKVTLLRTDLLSRVQRQIVLLLKFLYRHHGPPGVLARTWPTGSMVLWVALLLVGCLIFYYV